MRRCELLIVVAAQFAFCTSSSAAGLQIAPVMVDIPAPAAAGQITLKNPQNAPLSIQVRVYRWSQTKGGDLLTPTRDVVASPPLASIPPGSEQLVRIVKVGNEPQPHEDSYRLIVDELPLQQDVSQTAVRFAVRYSIPAFFSGQEIKRGDIAWSINKQGNRLRITMQNDGDRRVRLSQLKLETGKGNLNLSEGLVCYVLAHSTQTRSFVVPAGIVGVGAQVVMSAISEQGEVRGSALIENGG